ncbi:hypothetical protein BELL_0155g00180 [Botrytis elliptica]|uniref:Uncharacterized protein n=1 Tax=Botrytis elliptica TaxID=278938 RepID=A0A4Z1JYU3_9HELO|nr:hypothetical protein BELL_0155g00180 [Botrytis elliptica]
MRTNDTNLCAINALQKVQGDKLQNKLPIGHDPASSSSSSIGIDHIANQIYCSSASRQQTANEPSNAIFPYTKRRKWSLDKKSNAFKGNLLNPCLQGIQTVEIDNAYATDKNLELVERHLSPLKLNSSRSIFGVKIPIAQVKFNDAY